MSTNRPATGTAAKWSIPGFFFGVGVVALVTALVGGRVLIGVITLVIMVLCGLALASLGGGKRTPAPAATTSGNGVNWPLTITLLGAGLIIAFLGIFVGDLASGGNGFPYFWFVNGLAIVYVVVTALAKPRR